ncbi:hypothetical protein GCM10020331_057270 [Ectobacillus funiculus]
MAYNIPVEATLDVIGGKWKVVIMCHLIKGEKEQVNSKKAYACYHAKNANSAVAGAGGRRCCEPNGI